MPLDENVLDRLTRWYLALLIVFHCIFVIKSKHGVKYGAQISQTLVVTPHAASSEIRGNEEISIEMVVEYRERCRNLSDDQFRNILSKEGVYEKNSHCHSKIANKKDGYDGWHEWV